MTTAADAQPCAICATPNPPAALKEAAWLAPASAVLLTARRPDWRRSDGACPACVQDVLLRVLAERGPDAFLAGVHSVWPLDPAAAFDALPTPLRLHADPRFTGRGVTLALVDSGFYPHPDLVRPKNRILAWADAAKDPIEVHRYGPADEPAWPGWDAAAPHQWHGLMTSVAAAGNGVLSHGLYRGLAADADVVLVRARGDDGHISNANIARALHWLRGVAAELGVRVVSVSVAGDPVAPGEPNPVDEAVAELVNAGVAVIAAAGNEGVRRLVPPATAALALTVGGLDDKNNLDPADVDLWHGNFGESAGALKPEVVAPSLWVVAPVLPNSDVAREAAALFERRAAGDESAESRIGELKLVTPHYQHVEGTSFAAPVIAGVAAGVLQACPALTPLRLRELIVASARPVEGADRARQGAGVVEAGTAVALALAERAGGTTDARSPYRSDGGWTFRLLDPHAAEVRVVGSWDGWAEPGLAAAQVAPGVWEAAAPALAPGRYAYKYRIDGARWLADPANPARAASPAGGWDSLLVIAG